MMMDNNRKEALDKAKKAKQKMMVQAEMMKSSFSLQFQK